MPAGITDPSRYPRLPPHLLANARVVSHRNDLLPLLPKAARIVEVGVGLGDFSRLILDVCEPASFVAIDYFRLDTLDSVWGRPPGEIFGTLSHEDWVQKRFDAEIVSGIMSISAADSVAGMEALDDESVDVFYLDADARYEAVQAELDVAARKIKRDGWIILNDYTPGPVGHSDEAYGVIQATHEFMVARGWEMTHRALAWLMYCDVAIRRLDR